MRDNAQAMRYQEINDGHNRGVEIFNVNAADSGEVKQYVEQALLQLGMNYKDAKAMYESALGLQMGRIQGALRQITGSTT
jgi:hypothetical protein